MPTHKLTMIPLTLILLAGLMAGRTVASDWPIFRGPQHNGISYERHWGDDWANCAPKVRWTKAVGMGSSTVAVAAGRLYTMGNSELLVGKVKKACDVVYCLDAESGALLWSYSYEATLAPNSYEGGTSTTPTVVGDKVYTLSKQGLAYCFDAKTGTVLWQVDLVAKYGVRAPTWFFAGSPYPYGDLVIYNVGTHGLADGRIYARSTAGTLVCVEWTTTAPRVNAGNSVLTWLKAGATTVALNGSVADDTGDVTAIRWSVLSSPAGSAVVFADSSKPATTASFANPGLYVLELYAIDAKAQEGSDRIEVRVCADACETAKSRPTGDSVAAWYEFDSDCVEDFGDFAVFAAQWGARDFSDLAAFADQWLRDRSLTEDVLYDAGQIVLPAAQ